MGSDDTADAPVSMIAKPTTPLIDGSPMPVAVAPSTDMDSSLSDSNSSETSNANSRSSKRANSNVSVSDRSKFRQKLDSSLYTLLQSSSPLHFTSLNSGVSDVQVSKFSTETDHFEQTQRHYSASSVVQNRSSHFNINTSTESPLTPDMEFLWSNRSLHRLFPIKLINQNQLKTIMEWHYSNPLPECEELFPWLHGIHHSNQNQKEFLNTLMHFTTLQKNNFDIFRTQVKIPNSARGLMPIRSSPLESDDPSKKYLDNSGLIKGTVSPEDILCPLEVSKQDALVLLNNILKDVRIHENDQEDFEFTLKTLYEDCTKLRLLPTFKNLDPVKGISLRNFHIQVSKLSQISDFVVYCFNEDHLQDNCKHCCCASISRILYFTQLKHAIDYPELVDSFFATLILESNDLKFYKQNEENGKLLALDIMEEKDSKKMEGKFSSRFDIESFSNWDSNYLYREKLEISRMSTATHTIRNVWMGNTTDFEVLKLKNPKKLLKRSNNVPLYVDPAFSTMTITKEQLKYGNDELLITPAKTKWNLFINCCETAAFPDLDILKTLLTTDEIDQDKTYLSFPPAGSVGVGDCSEYDILSIINICKVIYTKSSKEKPCLIYCSDGYTELSLLSVFFLIYATHQSLDKVLLDLHLKYGRPIFLFPTDVTLISRIEELLLHFSPLNNERKFIADEMETLDDPEIYRHILSKNKNKNWCIDLNGSFPSRILSYLYLGSLNHACCFELLKSLGIRRIVCVGENLGWLEEINKDVLTKKVINNNIVIYSDFPNCPVEKVMCVSNIQDDGVDTLTYNLRDILEFIDESYHLNEKVLVHCRVGVSRSATVCIAEVMRRLNINLIRAYIYVRVRRLNVIIQPNLRFMYELVKWEENERVEMLNKHKIRAGQEDGLISVSSSPTNSKKMSIESTTVSSFEINQRLSESMASLGSSMSDSFGDISSSVTLLDRSESPVRLASNSVLIDNVFDNDSDSDESKVNSNTWLRDVDWHVLCREIDTLNKAYIKV